MDLAYYLFLQKGLRQIQRKLEKDFNEPPVGFNQRINQYENKRKGILNKPLWELKMKVAKAQFNGKNQKMNEDT